MLKYKKTATVIDFNNLHRYKHLSYAWFVRYSLILTINPPSDPLEAPISPDIVEEALDDINERIKKLLEAKKSRGKKTKKNSSKWKACPPNLSNEDDLLTLSDFKEYVNLTTECFMDFEIKEFVRVFGGGGTEVRTTVRALKAIAKLAKLGRILTSIGGSTFLFLDIDFALQSRVYGPVLSFMKLINENKPLADKVSYAVRLVAPSAIIIDTLVKERLSEQIKDLINKGVIMHVISDSGDSVIDLTSIVKAIHELRLAGHVSALTSILQHETHKEDRQQAKARGRRSDSTLNQSGKTAVDLLNKVSQTVIEYVDSHSLVPIYEYIRYAVTMLEKEEVKRELGMEEADKLLNTLLIIKEFQGLR